jgi:predicted GH43/DUF377 family glycosyl hydrolase
MKPFKCDPQPFRTPYKINRLVLQPSFVPGTFDSHAVDCPFPFFHQGRFYMTYIGWDSIGYRTGLAVSDDLLTWEKVGLILDRGPAGSVTEFNIALTSILRENELYGSGELKQVNGKYIGTYHAYPKPGYESGPAVIGICTSDDLRHWEVEDPVLKPDPFCRWEAGGLYKSWLMEHNGTYYLFYNAKNRTEGNWIEQIGLATSRDLLHFERYAGNPVVTVGKSGQFDDLFASDPCVFRFNDLWVMFYYGNCSDGHARDSAACSRDLLHWYKISEILVDVGEEGSIDSIHAHKPGLITKDGILYHFYCVVSPAKPEQMGGIDHNEMRGISLARSTPFD